MRRSRGRLKEPFGKAGSIRLALLIATLAAFLLVPAAQAFASGAMHVKVVGTGRGEVSSVGGLGAFENEHGENNELFESFGNAFEGSPPIQCSGPPPIGTCETPLVTSEALEGVESIAVHAVAASGSEFRGWTVEEGAGAAVGCEAGGPLTEEGETPTFCMQGGPGGGGGIKVAAAFCRDGETLAECLRPELPLTIEETGAGSGTVQCEVNGGGPEPCAPSYTESVEVKVTASPDAGSELAALSGTGSAAGHCTLGTGSCEFTIAAASSVHAAFKLESEKALTIDTAGGSGAGQVNCEVNGGPTVDAPCQASYLEGTHLKLIPVPAVHSEFAGFNAPSGSIACTGTATCEFTINANSSVNAPFDAIKHTLNVTVIGSGTLECKDEGAPSFGPCASSYAEGHLVKLKDTPAAHFSFTGWSEFAGSGAVTTPCAGAVADCEVKMDANVSGKATNTQIVHTLSIPHAGSGQGTVTCNGTACASSYPEGTEVVLAATAASGSSFGGWSGAGCSGTGTCKVTLGADTTVTATFNSSGGGGGGGGGGGSGAGTPPPAEQCVVPKLAKKSLGQAKAALKAAKCALGKVSKPKKSKGALVVKSSKPGPGTALPVGGKVNLKLGSKSKKG